MKLQGVNLQPLCRGEFPHALPADAVARLTACFTNFTIGVARHLVLASHQCLGQS